uniref:Uncharacterized protein n=1 Tax=Rhizophora mucronata TaxID=61149 RepID=A0A2P2L456_RHIMU
MRSLYQRILSSINNNERSRGGTSIAFRSYCSSLGDGAKAKIFDRHLKRKQRDRAAWLMCPNDPFMDAVAENLLDRLEVISFSFSGSISLLLLLSIHAIQLKASLILETKLFTYYF